MTPAQLLAGAQEIAARAPDARLIRNLVGNLAIAQGDVRTGWLDLRNGTVHWYDEATTP